MNGYDISEYDVNAYFLVIMIGSFGERTAVALKRQLSFLMDADKAVRLIYLNPVSGFGAESDSHEALCLDSERFQLNDEGLPSSEGLVYLRTTIGDRFHNFDAVFIVTDFRSEDSPLLAVGLSCVLSTKTISSQRFVLAIVAEPSSFELPQWRLAFQKGRVLLQQHCDTVIINSTKQVLNYLSAGGLPLSDYFEQEANAVANVIGLFAELTWLPSLIGIDFNDVVVVGMGEGTFVYGHGHGQGENAAEIAANQALARLQCDWADWDTPDIGLILGNLSGSDFSLAEYDLVCQIICSFFNTPVCIRIGCTLAPELPEDERRVKLLAVKNKTPGVYINREPLITTTNHFDTDELEFLDVPEFLRRRVD